jgi:hypothetical protein
VIDKDTIIFWGTQKRIITGSDILGRLMRGIVENQVRTLKKVFKRDLKLVTGIVALCYGTPGCGVSSCGVSHQLVNKLVLNNQIIRIIKQSIGITNRPYIAHRFLTSVGYVSIAHRSDPHVS